MKNWIKTGAAQRWLPLFILVFIGCNKNDVGDHVYQVFFYDPVVLDDNELGKYAVEVTDEGGLTYHVGTFEQDGCDDFFMSNCDNCKKHLDEWPNTLLTEGTWTYEVFNNTTNDVVDSGTINVDSKDLGKCRGIEVSF